MKIGLYSFCMLVGLSLSASAEESSQRDLVTRVRSLKCSGEGKTLEMLWDTAITPLGPIKISLDGKEMPHGGMRMTFDKGASIYEMEGLNIALSNEDLEKKSFSTTVQYQGKKIALNCTNENNLKFFRKRKTETAEAEPKTTRDLVTKINEMNCVGDGHDLEMKWDSAASPIGPAEILFDGRKLAIGGLTTSLGKDGSKYEISGLQIGIKNSDKTKKSFSTEAQYNGRSISLKCTNQESTKFFRKRNVESAPTSQAGGVK